MGDLATGTSGRYHGLLHSGGRYAVRDAESASECIDENRIVRRIAPEAIEPTSGFFVLCPGDDQTYVDQWLRGLRRRRHRDDAQSRSSEALKREPALNPKLEAIYEVPDGTCELVGFAPLSANRRSGDRTRSIPDLSPRRSVP